MQRKKIPVKKIIRTAAIALALLIVLLIGLYLMGYPTIGLPGSLGIGWNDPFWAALKEYDAVMESILAPLYPNAAPNEAVPGSTAIVSYFLRNDFTDELNRLDEIHQKAIQGDKASRDQRKKAKEMRAPLLRLLEEELALIDAAMEIVSRFTDQGKGGFTSEDSKLLYKFICLRRSPMRK